MYLVFQSTDVTLLWHAEYLIWKVSRLWEETGAFEMQLDSRWGIACGLCHFTHTHSLTLTPDHPHWGPLSPFINCSSGKSQRQAGLANFLALPLNSPRVREVSTCVAYVINTVVGICLPLSQPLTLSFLLYPWVVHLTSSSNSSSSISSRSSSQWTEWTCRQQATGGTDFWLGIPRYWGPVILCGKTRPNTESFTHGQHAHSPPPVPHPQAALIQLVVSISQISLVSKPELRKVTSTGQGKEIFCNSVVNIFAA